MVALGASGIMGIALEETSGTYTAPVKFVPFDSESLKWSQENVERRPIRNTPSLVGMIRGDGHIEGDITFDVTVDILIWFLAASRCTYTKTGTAPSLTYKFTPVPVAVPTKTMSITIKRGNETSGYTGCVVGGFTLSVDDSGAFKMTVTIVGNAESTQTAPTAVWPTTLPFGAGMYRLEIPTATQVFDTDKYEFVVEDNAEAQNRLKNTLGAQFVKFGENSTSVKVERDFETRAELDQYKALTAKSLTFQAIQGTDSVKIETGVSYIESYEYGLSSVGDLIRASVEYKCAINAAGNSFELTVVTSESLPS
jgi:hypothetical protein